MQSGQIQTKSSTEEKDQAPLIKLHYGIIKKSLDDLNNNKTYQCIKNAFEKLGEKSGSSILAGLIKEHSADHSGMHKKCPACLKLVSLINSSFFYGHKDENVRKAIIDSLKMLESLPKDHLSFHFNHFICDFYPFVTEECLIWTPDKIKINEYYFNFFDELDFDNRIFF